MQPRKTVWSQLVPLTFCEQMGCINHPQNVFVCGLIWILAKERFFDGQAVQLSQVYGKPLDLQGFYES